MENLPDRMKIAEVARYGPPDIFKLTTAPLPQISQDEILIRVVASSVSRGDVRLRGGIFPSGFGLIGRLLFGFNGPKKNVLGIDFAGEVVACGQAVTEFQVGDDVFGIDSSNMGANAEYKKVKATGAVVSLPKKMSHIDACSLVFGGTTALYFLKHRANLSKGQTILINGASGAVGSASVQLAKLFGAKVTAVCSGKNLALIKSLGADQVIDYQSEDIFSLDQSFDVIVDTVGNLEFSRVSNMLTKPGKFLAVIPSLSMLLASAVNKQIIAGEALENKEVMQMLKDLAEQKALKPIIDQIYKFDQIVEAHGYVQTGHKVGSVILSMD